MGNKKIYLTKKQIKRVNEDNSNLDINVDVEDGQNPLSALSDAKKNTENAAGSDVANKASYTLKGDNLNCGIVFTKKRIEEERVSNIMSNSVIMSKKELSKKLRV